MTLETAYAAHRGGRDEQQDRVAVFSAPEGDARLLVVADGMGGHAGGGLAAQAVADTAKAAWEAYDMRSGDPKALLQDIVKAAHAAVNRIGEEKRLSPRSTCVVLYVDGTRAVWMHVGDSRLYRFRDGRLIERTHDHSVVQMLLDMGKISEDEMGTHPDQNRLIQSLGGESEPEAELGEDAVAAGDSFVLCSDGLWEMVSPEEMAAGIAGEPLPRLAEQLPSVAFERAGPKSDNISIAIARVGAPKAAVAATPPGRRRRAMWGALAVVLVIGGAGVVALTQPSGPPSETKAPLPPAPETTPKAKPKPTPPAAPAPKPDPPSTPPAPGPGGDTPQGTSPSSPARPKSGSGDDGRGAVPAPRPSETPPTKSETPKTPDPAPPATPGPTEPPAEPKGPTESQGDDPKKPGDDPATPPSKRDGAGDDGQ